jgi:hypothetical protein
MMNPWDNERTWQEGSGEAAPSKSSGLLWLVAVVIAVVGLALLSKHGFNDIAVIPVGISLFFMVMFLISHRRETRRIAWKREVVRMQAHQQIQQVEAPRTAVDTTLRKVFDRYDLKVINHGRSGGWSPDRIASFLDYARDYVDTQHAGALFNGNEKGELDRHLDASLQRALLQHDIEHKTGAKGMAPPL